jgi:type I restriction enzyme S subunit
MPHYENMPFELPKGWVWCKLEDIAYVASGSTPSKECFIEKGVPYLKMFNLRRQKIDFEFHPQYIMKETHEGRLARSIAKPGDLIMNIVGPPLGKLAIIPPELTECNFNQAAVMIRPYLYTEIINMYLFYYLSEMSEINSISTKGSAGQVNISLTQSQNMRIPLPPLEEQKIVIKEIKKRFNILDIIESNENDIKNLTIQLKSKILELAIHGKLVFQDESDEPAIELLRRISPNFTPSDISHYENLPQGWCVCKLENVIDYEQPQPYIVESTAYSDDFSTPVLTAGKSFIIGYTSETEGIVNDLPVIIFDDFTTDSKYVDFPFKVKSSAIKILHVKPGVNPHFIAMLMSITRLTSDTHKRYWISECSKITIILPPAEEQRRIVDRVNELCAQLDLISQFTGN